MCRNYIQGRFFFKESPQFFCRSTCPRAPCAAGAAERDYETAARAELMQAYEEWVCAECGEEGEGEGAEEGEVTEEGVASTEPAAAAADDAGGAMEQ